MSAKIYYLNLMQAPEESGAIGFFEPDVSRLSKAAQVGPKRKPRFPFPCNRDRAWKKPLHGDAVRRK